MCYTIVTEDKIMLNNKLIGERLREARKERQLKQTDVSNAINVAASTIARYEQGKIKRLKLPVVESISYYLGVNPEWVLGKSDDKYNIIIPGVISPNKIDPDQFILYMYKHLDIEDKAEIRGEMKQMLKSDKYKSVVAGDISGDILNELRQERQIPTNSK